LTTADPGNVQDASGSTTTGSGGGQGSDAFETVFARICLERGWVTREQVSGCFADRMSSPVPPGGTKSRPRLSDLLVAKKLISTPQAEVLREEVTRLLRAEAYATVRQEASLGEILVISRRLSREQLLEALAFQGDCARHHEFVPMLGQVLIDKGFLSPAALEEALRLQRGMVRLKCESCGTNYLISEMDVRRVYLCRKCAAPLARADVLPVAPQEDPDEVKRAATNSSNVVGKYVAVRELGRGGMGTVYKAWDKVQKRWVALKIHTVTGGVEGLVRFRREAETAAVLQHPHIVPIYDVGESGERHYIAMKYIEGRPLGDRKLPVEQACRVMIEVARAIELAHSKDIVHRDLKPGNVIVDASGWPYVMDFGLAKNLFGSFNVTAPGTVMGSPSYMSPEQAAGQISKVDQRSDVYSLGALLYALLTGRPPFKADSPVATVRQVLDDPVVPPATLNPEIPSSLEAIVMRALSKDRAPRHPSAGPLADELERFLAGGTAPVAGGEPKGSPALPPKPQVGRKRWAMVGLLVCVLAGLALFYLWRAFQ
jgi:predicted Ser/Thr protein kinase